MRVASYILPQMKNGRFRRRSRLFFLVLLVIFFVFPMTASAAEEVVVVIDPGHGGENLGAEYAGYTEKELNMIVANAMYDELSKYDNVKVYLTRNSDVNLSLAERAEFAASVHADFMIALHFNMSEQHTLFGSEVWISAFDTAYQNGYAFGEAVLAQFDTIGAYHKGVKVRLNDRGEDYYGIIRESYARGVTTALIEHCYLDHENDTDFYNTTEKLERFGRLDATATAQYFGLSSEYLGVDYSDYEKVQVELPISGVKPDDTPPDICYIELIEADKEKRTLEICLSAEDYDSGMLYYSYSLDGGETFSALRKWPGADSFRFTVEVPNGITPHIVVNAYNKYDILAESNEIIVEGFPLVSESEQETVTIPEEPSYETTAETDNSVKTWEEFSVVKKEEQHKKDSPFLTFLKISGICLGLLLILLMMGYSYLHRQKKKRRRKF